MKLKPLYFISVFLFTQILLSACVSESSLNGNPSTASAYLDASEEREPQSIDSLDPNEVQELSNIDTNYSRISSFGTNQIIWPTNGVLTSLFGIRTLRRVTKIHTGIDIGAPKGTRIYAAADGRIAFAGRKRGYGYCIIINHDASHQTLYAHMSRVLVKRGQLVKRNKIIGRVGKSGKVTGANLHFETRVNGIAMNPLLFLPPTLTGEVKRGMFTPSFAEEVSYYNKQSRVAYSGKN